jgi:hypothetical protein
LKGEVQRFTILNEVLSRERNENEQRLRNQLLKIQGLDQKIVQLNNEKQQIE